MSTIAPAIAETYRKSPIGAILSIVVALLYGASPVDLIIDVIPIFGWCDDAAVISLLIVLAWHLAKKRTRNKSASSKSP